MKSATWVVGCVVAGAVALAAGAAAVEAAAPFSADPATLHSSLILRGAAYAAIMGDACAYNDTLAHARAPKWAGAATSGPALEGLRSLGGRLRHDGQTLELSDAALQIDSLSINRTGTRATATVTETAQVHSYRDGQALSRTRPLTQHVEITLDRGSTQVPFRVWNVTSIASRPMAPSQRA